VLLQEELSFYLLLSKHCYPYKVLHMVFKPVAPLLSTYSVINSSDFIQMIQVRNQTKCFL